MSRRVLTFTVDGGLSVRVALNRASDNDPRGSAERVEEPFRARLKRASASARMPPTSFSSCVALHAPLADTERLDPTHVGRRMSPADARPSAKHVEMDWLSGDADALDYDGIWLGLRSQNRLRRILSRQSNAVDRCGRARSDPRGSE